MQRTLNYTGRQSILRSAIDLLLVRDCASTERSKVSLNLEHGMFPSEARVFLEVYRRSSYKRFELGLVCDAPGPFEFDLRELAAVEGLSFRVKVVDPAGREAKSLILGVADRLQPVAGKDGRRGLSLLPVCEADLPGEIWRVSFDDDEGPSLDIDRSFYGKRNSLLANSGFGPLVMPAILRQIYSRIAASESIAGTSEVDDSGYLSDWQSKWGTFATSLGASWPPPDGSDSEAVEEWVNKIVDLFGARHGLHKKLAATLEDDDE